MTVADRFSMVIRFAGVSYRRFMATRYKFNLVMYVQGPLVINRRGKGRGKGRFMGLFNTAAVRPIVFLPPTSSRIHLQRRHGSYRCARPLPVKAGTITNEFC